MTKEERIGRAKILISFCQTQEFQEFVSLCKERAQVAIAAAYASSDPIEMAKFLGEAKGLDKTETIIRDEVNFVKRMLETK